MGIIFAAPFFGFLFLVAALVIWLRADKIVDGLIRRHDKPGRINAALHRFYSDPQCRKSVRSSVNLFLYGTVVCFVLTVVGLWQYGVLSF